MTLQTKKFSLTRFQKWFILLAGALILLWGFLYGWVQSERYGDFPSREELKNISLHNASLILDREGRVLTKLFTDNRIEIPLDSVSPVAINALIATEDQRFFDHNGVDHRSMLRVFFKTLLQGDRTSGGGSTLTQQLAKNLYPRRGSGAFALLIQKYREILLAYRLEDLYPKKEILTLYLNSVPFSDNTFGIEAASRHFFKTRASELTPSQAAILIGSLKATHSYNPRIFPERSIQRRNSVLSKMDYQGFLEDNQYEEALQSPMALQLSDNEENMPPFAAYCREIIKDSVSQILRELRKEDGTSWDVLKDGLIIKTSVDFDWQRWAETSMYEHLSQLQVAMERSYGSNPPWKNQKFIRRQASLYQEYTEYKERGYSREQIFDSLKRYGLLSKAEEDLKTLHASFLAVDPKSGGVRIWIGDRDYRRYQFDNISHGQRQVGSVFKPILYAAALEQGIDPCHYFPDREITYSNYENWTPSNASEAPDSKFMNYTMTYALSRSVNTIAVRVLEEAGISNVIQTARDLGITATLPEVPSLALGTASVNLLEMTGAYTAFANNGIPVQPYIIESITDTEGKVLYKKTSKVQHVNKGIAKETAWIIRSMMEETTAHGTASALSNTWKIPVDIASKTGTTQDNKDGWFMGVSPELVAGTWVGFSHHNFGFPSTSLGQGATSALPIYAGFMKQYSQQALRDGDQTRFPALPEAVASKLECETQKRDGFFKRLFSNPKKPKSKRFQTQETP